jgi:FkbM family methyltransferase
MKQPIIRNILSLLPFDVDIVGFNRNILLKITNLLPRDPPNRKIFSKKCVLNVNLSFSNERLLYYAFDNIINKYRKSEFYDVIKKFVNSESIFVDIGANLGIYSMLAKELGATTICFEPEPRHYNFLSRNKSIFNDVSLCALSNFEGKTVFNIANDNNLGGSSLTSSNREGNTGYESQIEVEVCRFDNFILKNKIKSNRITLIKIDVEGNEYETVCGMENFFKSGYKPAIWCEVRGPQSDRNPNNYLKVNKYLSEFGYTSYIVKNKTTELFVPEKSNISQVFDLLFLSN